MKTIEVLAVRALLRPVLDRAEVEQMFGEV